MGRSSSPRVGWAGPLPAHFPPGKERNSFPRFPQRSWMKKSPLLILSVLLAACGPDKLISDLPSPNGQYHVEVRKCPECSGQPIPDSGLSFSSATAGGNPSLN
ncbi:hypothetical protein LL325_27065, partial [Pseudomonas aeruginosa]|nr:hypothetical protein [Pseudomonas aeruginosa]